MYYIESSILLKLILLLVIVFLLMYAFYWIMRKILKVEKRSLFSNHYVNDKHKKIDWIIRGLAIIMLLVGFFINVNRDPTDTIIFFEPFYILIVSIIIMEVVRAIMERKYAKDPNAYKLTISVIVFIIILSFIMLKTNFFGLS